MKIEGFLYTLKMGIIVKKYVYGGRISGEIPR